MGGFVLKDKLRRLKADLKTWNITKFGCWTKELKRGKKKFLKLDLLDEALGLEESEIIARNRERALLLNDVKRRDSLLRQKARSKWIKEGDANSSYFHRCINKRRKCNEIVGININEEWKEDVVEVKNGIFEFFKSHISRRVHIRPSFGRDFGGSKIFKEDNQMLIAPVSEEEVWKAIKSCESSKSPGPDGFNFCFYKNFWEMYKGDFMRFMGEFHRNRRLAKGLNPSFTVLIRKKEEAFDLQDYRPISLIGRVYKILAKVLANRLSKVLGSIISENQSAFIEGRQLVDSVVSLIEAMEDAKAKKTRSMLFKIDFEKAYDSVDWVYLRETMEKMNFCSTWIDWMMECVSSAQASVLVNGRPSDNLNLERVLRQGDPLSPFLFLLAAEGISRLLKKVVEVGHFKPMEVGRDKVCLSHLQYADDTLF